MPRSLLKAAVSPLRRRFLDGDPPSVDAAVYAERPEEPMVCLRPKTIADAARRFVDGFPGDTLYAVKCNPEPRVLRALWSGGVRNFDCASIAEVTLVRRMFDEAASIHFMHPVKARSAIAESWRDLGVRDFVVDTADELNKVLKETGGLRSGNGGLGVVVRMATPAMGAAYDLSGKFGAKPTDAAALLVAARGVATRLGLSFHVGSQMLRADAWAQAIDAAAEVVRLAGVPIEIVDVGGGFPAAYDGMTPASLPSIFRTIATAVDRAPPLRGARLWAEPGRALVADGASIVVQVQLRRGDDLYLNDGVYGSLADAKLPEFRFPLRLIPRDRRTPDSRATAYRWFGPTCDSADRIDGPFRLPACVREGDWIEIGQTGAYATALRTDFNGMGRARLIEVCDPPLSPAALPAAMASDRARAAAR